MNCINLCRFNDSSVAIPLTPKGSTSASSKKNGKNVSKI